MDAPAGPQFEVECPFAPDLVRLGAALRARLRYEPESGRLFLRGGATSPEIQSLRDCHPSELAWQMAVDRLAAQAREGGAAPASSRFPSTPWGLLLAELGTRDDAHWARFMKLYRKPIGKSIAKAALLLGRRETASAEELADEFFSWFFDKRIYAHLRRVGESGKVNRFRGYLRRCVGTFLKEERRAPLTGDLGLEPSGPDGLVAQAVDEELCRDALEEELARLRADDPGLWRALVYDFQRLSLEEMARRMGFSVPTAHRLRKKARAVLRDRLIQHRLRNGVATEEEAADEWEELFPVLSRVIEEIAAGIRAE